MKKELVKILKKKLSEKKQSHSYDLDVLVNSTLTAVDGDALVKLENSCTNRVVTAFVYYFYKRQMEIENMTINDKEGYIYHCELETTITFLQHIDGDVLILDDMSLSELNTIVSRLSNMLVDNMMREEHIFGIDDYKLIVSDIYEMIPTKYKITLGTCLGLTSTINNMLRFSQEVGSGVNESRNGEEMFKSQLEETASEMSSVLGENGSDYDSDFVVGLTHARTLGAQMADIRSNILSPDDIRNIITEYLVEHNIISAEEEKEQMIDVRNIDDLVDPKDIYTSRLQYLFHIKELV